MLVSLVSFLFASAWETHILSSIVEQHHANYISDYISTSNISMSIYIYIWYLYIYTCTWLFVLYVGVFEHLLDLGKWLQLDFPFPTPFWWGHRFMRRLKKIPDGLHQIFQHLQSWSFVRFQNYSTKSAKTCGFRTCQQSLLAVVLPAPRWVSSPSSSAIWRCWMGKADWADKMVV